MAGGQHGLAAHNNNNMSFLIISFNILCCILLVLACTASLHVQHIASLLDAGATGVRSLLFVVLCNDVVVMILNVLVPFTFTVLLLLLLLLHYIDGIDIHFCYILLLLLLLLT